MKKNFAKTICAMMSVICAFSTVSICNTFAEETAETQVVQASAENKGLYPSPKFNALLGSKNFNYLVSNGIIAENPESVTAKPEIKENVEISSVIAYKNIVAVTLNAQLKKINTSDVILKKYTSDWYSLDPKLNSVSIEKALYTLNDKGETVFVYKIKEAKAEDSSSKNFENLEEAIKVADNYLSWQMDHGGWDKQVDKQADETWNGTDPKNKYSGWASEKGEPLGTIDNKSTYTQMRHIAAVYRETKDKKYKDSIEKGLEFIFKLQGEKGGLTQVYPKRGNYSDYVTFNDNAMISTLIMLEDMEAGVYPFDSDIISSEYKEKISTCIDKAVDYILKSQIKSQGKLTAWCAQHDPETYEAKGGRAYELPSISGSESVNIVKFLMNRKEQTPEIKTAVDSAITWFKESALKGHRYDKKDPSGKCFIEDKNAEDIWYRFYEIDTNLPIFSGRDGVKKHDVSEIDEERRTGYTWAGKWPQKLIDVYDNQGYYPNKIVAVVNNNKSTTSNHRKLVKKDLVQATYLSENDEK